MTLARRVASILFGLSLAVTAQSGGRAAWTIEIRTLQTAIQGYDTHIRQTQQLIDEAQAKEAADTQAGNTTGAANAGRALSIGQQALALAQRYRSDAEARLAALTAALAWPASDAGSAVTLLYRGTISVQAADGTQHAFDPRAPLKEGDEIRVAAGGYFEFEAPDGSRIALGAECDFRYVSGGTAPLYEVIQGRIHSIGQHLLGTRFEVRRPNISVAVRGTEFTLTEDANGVSLEVLEGAVDVQRSGGKPPVSVSAGQRLNLPAAGSAEPPAPQSFDARTVTPWWQP